MMFLDQEDCLMQLPDEYLPRTDTNIVFYHDQEVLVLSMPYGNGDFRMSIVMPFTGYGRAPDGPGTIDDVLAGLTPEKWQTWTSGKTPFKFYLELPRFKFGYEVELNETLKTLGMEIAFDPSRADFSDMFVDGEGWIDKAKHKTFIQVDEKGTEAAAVTQVIFLDSMPPPVICDRPFLIVIHEDVSGTILFMGRIANPVWED
jgi:serpin B